MIKRLHIILAGGKATRFGTLSKGVPKAIMPLGNSTLLHRQIAQSLSSGDTEILVATNKLFAKQIEKAVEDYPEVKVIYKTNDVRGPLSTLKNILKTISNKTTVILTLGDIYFLKNPFTKLNINMNKDVVYLAGAKAFDPKDLALGGVVFTKNQKITGVIKKPIAGNKKGYKWSGTAVFKANIKKDLARFLQSDKNEIEDFFEDYRLKKHKMLFIEISDFINVNKIEDFHIATLYDLAEVYKNDRKKIFTTTANKLRKEFLKNQ